VAISSLLIPWAAMRIIFARWTSHYGNVYFSALRLSSPASSADRSIRYGLTLGMGEPSARLVAKMPYVSVFQTLGTKSSTWIDSLLGRWDCCLQATGRGEEGLFLVDSGCCAASGLGPDAA
jgi:hypothetical protein